MNLINLVLGILICTISILYLIYSLNGKSKLEKEDYIGQYNYIKIYGGVFIFIVLGIVLIYRELKNIF